MNEHSDSLYLAGMYFDPMLSDVDILEGRLHGLALDAELSACIDETLDLMNSATAFWLDESGCHEEHAARTCVTVHRHLDAILQASEFHDSNALAATIRQSIWEDLDTASDSQLVAAYVMALAVESLQTLCNWLLNVRREAIAAVQTTESATPHRVQLQQARRELHREEVQARVTHAEYMGKARLAMYIADLYRHAETLSRMPDGYRVAEQLRNAIETTSKSTRAKIAGQGNRAPGSAKQMAAMDTRERINQAATRVLKARPGISRTELVSVLLGQGLATRPTIKKHLAALDLPTEEN
ncbi:hypothetical protein D3C78_381670 [compost metagenome]